MKIISKLSKKYFFRIRLNKILLIVNTSVYTEELVLYFKLKIVLNCFSFKNIALYIKIKVCKKQLLKPLTLIEKETGLKSKKLTQDANVSIREVL